MATDAPRLEPFELETSRLQLRPVGQTDLSALTELFRDSEVRRYLLDDMLVPETWVEDEIQASDRRFQSGSGGLWAVRKEGSAEIIGFAGFREFFDPPELQLLYGMHPASWGHGFATEAATAVMEFGFQALGFEEIRAATDLPNEASIRVLERLGMSRDRVTEDGAFGTVFYRISARVHGE